MAFGLRTRRAQPSRQDRTFSGHVHLAALPAGSTTSGGSSVAGLQRRPGNDRVVITMARTDIERGRDLFRRVPGACYHADSQPFSDALCLAAARALNLTVVRAGTEPGHESPIDGGARDAHPRSTFRGPSPHPFGYTTSPVRPPAGRFRCG